MERVTAQDLIEYQPAPAACTAVLIFKGRPDMARREAVLNALQTFARLGVVIDADSGWSDQGVDWCHEAVSWPCHVSELEFRLRRVEALAVPAWSVADTNVHSSFDKVGLVGESQRIRELMRAVRRIGPSDAPVLIEGETGTGKELVAQALHDLGPRRNGTFVAVNCGAIPDELLASELFGAERGAFTDAKERRAGLVEQAHHGTLFLDEIECLSAKGQAMMLRFLQDREYRPLGAKRPRRVDVRILVASNVPLGDLVSAGRFRQDLFFRLDLLRLRIPPLRERGEDIRLLALHFAAKFRAAYQLRERGFHPTTVVAMRRYEWPGNVRELENFVHRAVLMTAPQADWLYGDPVCRDDEPAAPEPDDTPSFQEAKERAVSSFEREYLRELLQRTGGNVTEAARQAGKERRALGKLLKRHGISRLEFLDTRATA